LHALELGVAVAARWIAVELLRDPERAPGEDRVVGAKGVYLRLRSWDHPAMQLVVCDTPLGVYDNRDGTYRAWWRDIPSRYCAVEEQALAVLIEHAAPWIAAELAKEIGA
jgi:hypothetical protein